jgi:hypothetical protein
VGYGGCSGLGTCLPRWWSIQSLKQSSKNPPIKLNHTLTCFWPLQMKAFVPFMAKKYDFDYE